MKNLFGATLLIAGTCIGGGMLALPVDTGLAGFFPAALFMILSWAFMTATALLLVEANLWMEEGTHVMTMATRLLGKFGKYTSLVLFLFKKVYKTSQQRFVFFLCPNKPKARFVRTYRSLLLRIICDAKETPRLPAAATAAAASLRLSAKSSLSQRLILSSEMFGRE